ncbi:MAG: hypothetical protein RBS01_01965, partial [Candidatus Dojkabacteria bacterium]|nr:hypothetical protein [Candidatus Dojkabacteria bacterium]
RVRVSNIVYRSIIVFLLFVIIGATFFIIGVVKKLSYIPEDVSSVLLETLVCTNCEKEEEEIVKEEITLENEGWSLYQNPELGLKAEIPSDSFFNPNFSQNPTNRLVWSIYSYDSDDAQFEPDIFNNFSKRVRISFFPIEIPSDAGCGGGCLGESLITLDYYKNSEDFTYKEIETEFVKYITESQKEIGDPEEYTIEKAVSFGKEVLKYEYSAGMGDYKGYIALSKDNIVVINEYIYSTGDNLEIVEKVIDSIHVE